VTPTQKGSFRIFSLAGIGVFVHWSWFIVAYLSIRYRTNEYGSPVWNVLEYVGLFLIVLTHEFGHQLACRSVGGVTHDIILWPLGGVAYVSPPQRPGAQLWSIAAGPLVNVALMPVLLVLLLFSRQLGWPDAHPDVHEFLSTMVWINTGLLIFNLLPIYPLDGGQILRSLLWFVVGRANSLMAVSVLGFVGVAGLIGLAVLNQSIWIGIIAAFILLNCWQGLNQARILARIAKLPRRVGYQCPACQTAPPVGERWRCGQCGRAFDTFLSQAVCPHCGVQYPVTQCLDCGSVRPIHEWLAGEPPARADRD
jgi:Zn-dependent protease